MKKKIFVIVMGILIGLSMGIIKTEVSAKTAPSKIEAKICFVKISNLKFKHNKNNETEIMGSITNTSTFTNNTRFIITFSEIDKTKTGTYKYMINSKNIKAGETIKFNVKSYNKNLKNKRYTIKLVDLDSEI